MSEPKLARDDLLHLTDHFALQGTGHPIHAELIEAKLRYLDRITQADSADETASAFNTYHEDVFYIVHGQFFNRYHDFASFKAIAKDAGPSRHGDETPVRSLLLGDKYDAALVKLRTDYVAACARARYRDQASKAFYEYHKKVVQIVDEAIETTARELRDRKTIVIDRTAEPAPEPALAQPEPVPRVTVESVEHVETVDAAELERALSGTPPVRTAETVVAIGGHVEFEHDVESEKEKAKRQAKKRDPYDEYDERISSAYKTPPPVPKRRKRTGDPVA
ncbi:MAG: hypothetical protein IT536_08310 [Hyphomicrobiales bacterium]|nr:hypothetical protein [Hyphomicrobiales bacterium]